jgi:tetratricopeptide (TPR) repeat protein
LTRALASAAESEPAVRARALMRLGAITEQLGDFDAAEIATQEAVDIRRGLGDLAGASAALCNLGTVALSRNDFGAAKEIFTEVLEIGRSLDSDEDCASALCNLGVVAVMTGEYLVARPLLEESLELAKKLGHLWGQSAVEGALGALASDLGELNSASRYLWSSLEIARELDSPGAVSSRLEELAFVAARGNAAATGVYVYAAAAALRERHGLMADDYGNRRDKIVEALRLSLDGDTFDAGYAAGLEASPEQVYDRIWSEIVLAASTR